MDQKFALWIPLHVKGRLRMGRNRFIEFRKPKAARKNVLLDQCTVLLVNVTKSLCRQSIHLIIIFRRSKDNKRNYTRILFHSRNCNA
jgi:hypothetical protein